MKQDWERTEAVVMPPRHVMDRLVEQVRPFRTLTSVDVLSGGLANTNLRLRLDSGDMVLRLYQRDPAAREVELRIARELRGHVPVAEFLASGEPSGDLTHAWALIAWVDGESMDSLTQHGRAAELASAARDAGAVLARIQATSRADPLVVTAAEYGEWIEQVLDGLGVEERLPFGLPARIRRIASIWGPRLDILSADSSLVHCDYNGANLLVKDGRIAAVLDWEFAMAGSTLWDVANMVRHYADAGPGVEQAFIAGFREAGGRLPDGWRALAALLDIVNLGDMLSKSAPGSGRERSMLRSIAAHVTAAELLPL